jgi:hypothetical protein
VLRQHGHRHVGERRKQPGPWQVLYRHVISPRVFQPTRASCYAPRNLKEVNMRRSEKFQS